MVLCELGYEGVDASLHGNGLALACAWLWATSITDGGAGDDRGHVFQSSKITGEASLQPSQVPNLVHRSHVRSGTSIACVVSGSDRAPTHTARGVRPIEFLLSANNAGS